MHMDVHRVHVAQALPQYGQLRMTGAPLNYQFYRSVLAEFFILQAGPPSLY
jgi:hypothetical protein